ncbi:transposable element Tcb1 transposase [Trichonephila clavipes]|nr:transposable element Tcb1 transposase [Trichonephila clavipes]
MVTSSPKVVFHLWNQFKTSSTVTRKVCQGRVRASTSAQNWYLALSAQRHRRTRAPHFARDLAAVSGRRISRQTVYSNIPETGLYASRPVWRVHLTASSRKNRILCTSVVDTTKRGRILFSDESKCPRQSDSHHVFNWREMKFAFILHA